MFQFTSEQQRAVELALEGESVLVVGHFATGKTVVLAAIATELRKIVDENRIVEMQELTPTVIRTLDWHNITTLIIDNAGKLKAKHLELLDRTGRGQRDPTRPFGGIQLVLSTYMHCLMGPVWNALQLHHHDHHNHYLHVVMFTDLAVMEDE